jgi:hypothetical protein
VLNNPLKYTDPTGHCISIDGEHTCGSGNTAPNYDSLKKAKKESKKDSGIVCDNISAVACKEGDFSAKEIKDLAADMLTYASYQTNIASVVALVGLGLGVVGGVTLDAPLTIIGGSVAAIGVLLLLDASQEGLMASQLSNAAGSGNTHVAVTYGERGVFSSDVHVLYNEKGSISWGSTSFHAYSLSGILSILSGMP